MRVGSRIVGGGVVGSKSAEVKIPTQRTARFVGDPLSSAVYCGHHVVGIALACGYVGREDFVDPCEIFLAEIYI